jgi:hypothetical protein
MHKVIDLRRFTMSEAYDFTQCSGIILDGDIMLVDDGVAVMVEAWPAMAVGESKVFHMPTADLRTEDRYISSFIEASQPLETLEKIAKAYDLASFFDEIDN